jgi:hypothetical protein
MLPLLANLPPISASKTESRQQKIQFIANDTTFDMMLQRNNMLNPA